MFTYKLRLADGTDAGQATYAVPIKPGDEVNMGNGRRLRVLDVVPVDEDGSKIVGMLQVEAA